MYRKIYKDIEKHFKSDDDKILVLSGARQVGKTYIIRKAGMSLFENFVEVNFIEDSQNNRLFSNVKNIDDFYLQLSMIAGDSLGNKNNTLVFLDEIQEYPHFMTMLKFLREDGRFTYVASGSLLGVALAETSSIPIGSIKMLQMYPMDFEEFLYANGVNEFAVEIMRKRFESLESLAPEMHKQMLDYFRKYILVGGMPAAVSEYIKSRNIVEIRKIQKDIHDFYSVDASKYDTERRLQIRRIFSMIPSNMENKKKRVKIKEINGRKGSAYRDYADSFDYIINSGIALETKALSTPVFPLIESTGKNLLKLYLNDVGILTGILYRNNIRAVLDDEASINLGSVYESVVAQELKAHGFNLFYYDNRTKGEVDFLIDDYSELSALPIEVKSGKDYTVHSALNTFLSNEDYHVKKGYVLSNEREVIRKDNVIYMPIYYVMFMDNNTENEIII